MGDIIIDEEWAQPSREADATLQRLALSYDRIEVCRWWEDGMWEATALDYMAPGGYRVVEIFHVRDDDGSYTSNLIERKWR